MPRVRVSDVAREVMLCVRVSDVACEVMPRVR
jgi:hypothetical protein